MTTPAIDPSLDLTLQRVIRAPRHDIWRAWTEPALLERWWIPAPMRLRVDVLDARAGGGLRSHMSEDGDTFVPHMDAVFLLVEHEQRLVFTNAVDSAWRPSAPEPVAMTAEVILDAHPEGTDYRVIVRHASPAQRAHHEELGFFEGWGAVTDALEVLVEGGAGQHRQQRRSG